VQRPRWDLDSSQANSGELRGLPPLPIPTTMSHQNDLLVLLSLGGGAETNDPE
jgi:hypothetical protein